MNKSKILLLTLISCFIHILFLYFLTQFLREKKTATPPPSTSMNYFFIAEKRIQKENFQEIIKTKEIGKPEKSTDTGKTDPKREYFTPSHYLDSSIVDTRPAPISDWLIDNTIFSKKNLKGTIIQFTLWVSKTGKIDHLEFLNQENIPVEIQHALRSLEDTKMAPATLKDIPVPCVLTVELNFGY